MSTQVEQFFADLDGGVFEEKISRILSDVAGATVDYQAKGQVVITLDFKQIGNSDQVQIDHKISYKRPTKRGSASETDTTTTPMYVGSKGALTFFPEKQGQLLDKKGGVADSSVTKFPNARG